MSMNDLTKKRKDEDIYNLFHKEIKKGRLADAEYLFVNIKYQPKDTMQQIETRCMFYEFKDTKCESFKALVYDKLDSSLNGQAIRATEAKILIEDQEDMYGAILKHANDTKDKEMNVYLTANRRSPYPDEPSTFLKNIHDAEVKVIDVCPTADLMDACLRANRTSPYPDNTVSTKIDNCI